MSFFLLRMKLPISVNSFVPVFLLKHQMWKDKHCLINCICLFIDSSYSFAAWCVNPFAALSLCWLTENYAVAYEITQCLAQEEISISMLLQADKLVQLLESPVFVHVRLQLLNTSSPSVVLLLQSLYGLLMILPQSNSYRLLQNRLSSITPLHVIMLNHSES